MHYSRFEKTRKEAKNDRALEQSYCKMNGQGEVFVVATYVYTRSSVKANTLRSIGDVYTRAGQRTLGC